MTDSKRSEEEVHVLDSQIIRIDIFEAKGTFSSIQLVNENRGYIDYREILDEIN